MKTINNKIIKELVTALKQGAVLVLSTDTVYGLVCDATNKMAVEKIFKIKKRSKIKSLPIFVKDLNMAKKYSIISKEQERTIKEKWPGAFTFIVKGKKGLSPLVYKKDTIAVRQPNHKLVLDIVKILGKPLAQTSANISDFPATTKIKEVKKYFENSKVYPDIILDFGNLQKNKPSMIIDLTLKEFKLLRK